jgi:hypothetical protein
MKSAGTLGRTKKNTKNESNLYIVHVTEEFGELIQRWEQHGSYIEEVKQLS